MNIRKPVDYSAMFKALDDLIAVSLPQMELYSEIGRLIGGRLEKGAAVAAAEYLRGTYPNAAGFSPRNLSTATKSKISRLYGCSTHSHFRWEHNKNRTEAGFPAFARLLFVSGKAAMERNVFFLIIDQGVGIVLQISGRYFWNRMVIFTQ